MTIIYDSAKLPTNPKFIDITGKRFGNLFVTGYIGSKNKRTYWACICDCGVEKHIQSGSLISGKTRSCGCKMLDGIKRHNDSIKITDRLTYSSFNAMTQRCQNKNNKAYKDYGLRGISICTQWQNNFIQFLNDMGERPTKDHFIERIDNEKGYFPDNCYWATRTEQNRNTRKNIYITYKGITKCISEWAVDLDIKSATIRRRIKKGWCSICVLTVEKGKTGIRTVHRCNHNHT